MDCKVESIWPEWRTVKRLGEGSFGKVYEVVRNQFGIEEHCAVKVISIPSSQAELDSLKSDGMDDASITAYYRGLVDEFVQEIALMSKLKGHINVVNYEDFTVVERKDGIGWNILIRMELLTALPKRMAASEFREDDVINMAIDVCSALELCYDRKIVHRDIKPDNIFVSSAGDYKLGDFGVARTVDKTISGLSKKGTYTYMAPEVYRGDPCGMDVDLYSLGIVMYKLLNDNREPFLPPPPQLVGYAEKHGALERRLRGDQIPAPRHGSRGLCDIVLKACAFRSADRYRTPTQMKKALEALLAETAERTVKVVPLDEPLPEPSLTKVTGDRSLDETDRIDPSIMPDASEQDILVEQDDVLLQVTSPTLTSGVQGDVRTIKWYRFLVTALGWVGVILSLVVLWQIIGINGFISGKIMVAATAKLVVASSVVLVTLMQLLFTAGKESRVGAFLMLVFSIPALSPLNAIAAILWWKYRKKIRGLKKKVDS